ncbi:MAG: phosphomannomutase [Proteobacteria bacterium]|nr:phosphomannomutase [Pseudomonadota bacterium]
MDIKTRLDTCFKAYDVRGRVPEVLDDALAYRIGFAFAKYLGAKEIVVGADVRDSSEALKRALSLGLNDAGCKVIDIGLCGTEEIYFATFHLGLDGGVMVTASHNPLGWNGMKLVRDEARPISGDEGLDEIKALAAEVDVPDLDRAPDVRHLDNRPAFVEHLLGYIDHDRLRKLKIVANPGNGGAGLVVNALEPHLPFVFEKVHFDPDGSFPNGVPNPLLPENREATSRAVRESGADFGIAWDGDFDRCFFFDEHGNFLEGYYLVGLLGAQMLKKHPGAAVVYEPRLTWNTIDMVTAAGGKPVISKTGHAFLKASLRACNATYGGEMSAHHYFRDFNYCDSGMIPWLLIAERLSESGASLSSLVSERIAAFPCSGEINRTVDDADAVIAAIEHRYSKDALDIDYTDGISMEFAQWRFNLRKSNTEPVIRLNVESRGDAELTRRKTEELLAHVGGKG